jgi:hypothetical protein
VPAAGVPVSVTVHDAPALISAASVVPKVHGASMVIVRVNLPSAAQSTENPNVPPGKSSESPVIVFVILSEPRVGQAGTVYECVTLSVQVTV